MTTDLLWLGALALPAALAVVLLRRTPDPARSTAAAAPATLLPLAVLAVLGTGAGSGVAAAADGGLVLVDAVSRPLVLVATVLYAAALVVTARAGSPGAVRLTALLLLCCTGNALALLAADVLALVAGCLLTTVAVALMARLPGTAAARSAARVHLALAVAADAALVAAAALVVGAGARRLADVPAVVADSPVLVPVVALTLVAFGIRAATFPLHGWLPLLESTVAIPVGAVLSGSVVKIGLVGLLRLLPLGEVALPGWGTAVVVVALVGGLLALVPGVLNDDAEVSLGYSTVGQMGFITVLVGVALAIPELAQACALSAVVYAVHHGMAKGGLVLSVQIWQRHGGGPLRALVLAGAAVLALAVVGAPFGSGAVAKYAAKRAIADGPELTVITVALPFVATVSTLILVRTATILRRHVRPGPVGADVGLVSWAVLCLGGTAATWYLAGQWVPVLSVPALDTVTLWQATWPVLLGLGIAGLAAGAVRAGLVPARVRSLTVPRGDLVALLGRALDAASRRRGRAPAGTATPPDGPG
ncbi:proton-conducting transporter membrane subunit [Cellulosimicrobium cellulans]|uniref:proton-conducting transporter transmembrane domain-containing protein n=1 Tax=Cellulosimicrobium cellulans TaxID=1710 RepID=UPI00130EBA08|nr:proton-conducting transporter membrane subunit [Cellulosimicrobium cellulans]